MEAIKDRRMLAYEGKRTLLAALGALIYAAGTNLFIVPSGLYSSGIMGLCQVLRTMMVEYLHLNFGKVDIAGMIYYVIN
ncbi:MAG: YitT family protein, partial [Acetatifactor sp.]|nr:YitT family protein [Acetatifactor sp.]